MYMAFTDIDGSFEVWTRERILRNFVFNRVRTAYPRVVFIPAGSFIRGLWVPGLIHCTLALFPDYFSFRGEFRDNIAIMRENIRRHNERVGLVAPP
ncbi:hypothetical protein CAEBREN_12411 [Caenorhabditis brenneri]|uniref:Uncharacterized protein n=1 Tax=Caenorhabditis brenneri TaxID=135651 RepID=G0NW49_CAEBE|nr:hypothetical protein CAEBREN_12411 [Caenorhabditis brenneri]